MIIILSFSALASKVTSKLHKSLNAHTGGVPATIAAQPFLLSCLAINLARVFIVTLSPLFSKSTVDEVLFQLNLSVAFLFALLTLS